MKRVALVLNPSKDPAFAVAKSVAAAFSSRGCPVFVSDAFAAPLAGAPGVRFLPDPLYLDGADLALVLGGDGTILSIASFCARRRIPVLAVNLGTVGFMAQLKKEDPLPVERLLSDSFECEERMMLETLFDGKDPYISLNECCVSLDHGFHILTMDLYLGEKRLCGFKADGVIFSTPTGSTGYSFSAGGALVDSALDCIGVKAICPYMLRGAHHLLFSPDTVLTVKNIRTHAGRLYASFDGREEREVKEENVLTVRRAAEPLRLVRFEDRSNIEIFFEKF